MLRINADPGQRQSSTAVRGCHRDGQRPAIHLGDPWPLSSAAMMLMNTELRVRSLRRMALVPGPSWLRTWGICAKSVSSCSARKVMSCCSRARIWATRKASAWASLMERSRFSRLECRMTPRAGSTAKHTRVMRLLRSELKKTFFTGYSGEILGSQGPRRPARTAEGIQGGGSRTERTRPLAWGTRTIQGWALLRNGGHHIPPAPQSGWSACVAFPGARSGEPGEGPPPLDGKSRCRLRHCAVCVFRAASLAVRFGRAGLAGRFGPGVALSARSAERTPVLAEQPVEPGWA